MGHPDSLPIVRSAGPLNITWSWEKNPPHSQSCRLSKARGSPYSSAYHTSLLLSRSCLRALREAAHHTWQASCLPWRPSGRYRRHRSPSLPLYNLQSIPASVVSFPLLNKMSPTFSFYMWGNWSSTRLKDQPEITNPVTCSWDFWLKNEVHWL